MPVYHNSAYLVAADGRIVATYDKERLLPFSEYFPFDLDVLRRRFERVRTFTPGASTPPLPTVAGPAGVLICNEAVFPEIAAARVRAGAGYLVNLANDTWLGDWKYAVRVFDLVALRAVEQRRWLVRVSTSGPSAVVDPWGRIAARTPPFTEATVTAEIAPRTGRTPYARMGDAFGWACAVVAGWALVRRRAGPEVR
jgi:apolipoprotein N-acyltransferase